MLLHTIPSEDVLMLTLGLIKAYLYVVLVKISQYLLKCLPDTDGVAAMSDASATWSTTSTNEKQCLAIRMDVNTAMESWMLRSLTCM